MTVEQELDGIDIDEIGNVEDLPKLMFINEECGNLQLVNDGGELTRNINQKKKSNVSQSHGCPPYPMDNHVEYYESAR